MVEFNPDGSIKFTGRLAKQKSNQDYKMQNTRCMQIRKEIISTYAPKSCALHLTLSNKIEDNRFVENIYQEFCKISEVPTKFMKINDKEFKVEVGTCFRRCSDCTSLVRRYRMFLESNLIELGNCDYSTKRASSFTYEDYFD